MARKQKVVRTYPNGGTKTTERLEELLDKNWLVVMRTVVKLTSEGEYIEYILEKDE